MLVKNWMTKPAITIDSEATIQDALGLLKKHSIHILPVMEEERLVGIVTGSDLKSASVSNVASLEIHDLLDLISRIKVKMVMNKEPISVPYDYTMEETAIKFFVHNISGAPVVDQVGKVVGVVTKNDLFRVFISLTGISKKGIHFAFKLPDRPGSIKEVTDMIRNHGGRIASMLSTREKIEKGYFKVYIRAYGLDSSARQRLKQTIKETLPLVYIIDHTENVREIFEQE